MICESCRCEISKDEVCDEERELCFRCYEIMKVNKSAEEIIPFLLKHNMEVKKVEFGNGEGFCRDVCGGIILNFYQTGRVSFDYNKDIDDATQEKNDE